MKLSQALSQDTRDMVRSLEQVVTFADASTHMSEPVDVDHLKTVLAAVTSHHQIQMSYHAWSDEIDRAYRRSISRGLSRGCAGISWVTVICGWISVSSVSTTYTALRSRRNLRPARIDALAAVEQSIGQVPWRWEYRVQLDLSLEDAAQRIPRLSPAWSRGRVVSSCTDMRTILRWWRICWLGCAAH